MAKRVYRYRHGWIKLDHEAVDVLDESTLNPVAADHLKRRSNIVAGHRNGQFILMDRKTGHTAKISDADAVDLHERKHVITAIDEDGKVNSSSAEALAEAEKATKVAKAVEPRLTKLAVDLAEAHGGTPEGLDFRLKTTDSLARKLDAEVADAIPPGSLTVADAVAKMFDINRYTTVLPEGEYAAQSQQILDKLRDQGFTLKVKNYWNNQDNPYQGLNVQVTSPEGHQFEFQYHSPASLEVKEKQVHPIYEKRRVETDPAKKAEYDDQMAAIYATIPIPPGIETVA